MNIKSETRLVDLTAEDSKRPETGPMEFEDDWRGIFIRGDHALMSFVPFLMMLRERLDENDVMYTYQIDQMISLFQSANHHGPEEGLQKMKSFNQCRVVSLPVVK